jgi:uncharacterized CHY-type Zn-finger protein
MPKDLDSYICVHCGVMLAYMDDGEGSFDLSCPVCRTPYNPTSV